MRNIFSNEECVFLKNNSDSFSKEVMINRIKFAIVSSQNNAAMCDFLLELFQKVSSLSEDEWKDALLLIRGDSLIDEILHVNSY